MEGSHPKPANEATWEKPPHQVFTVPSKWERDLIDNPRTKLRGVA